MGQVAWKWIREDGKLLAVEVAGKAFTVRKFRLEDVASFMEALESANWVFQRILNTVQTFEAFRVESYEGAAAKLASLRLEYRKAETEFGRAALDIGFFFEPAGAGKAFMPDSRALHDFIQEAELVLPEYAQDAPRPELKAEPSSNGTALEQLREALPSKAEEAPRG
jgi:hypothetical protein